MPRHAIAALALALAAAAPPVAADTLAILASRERGPGESADRETTIRLWIGDQAVARDDGRQAAVLRPGELVLVDHESRSYSVIDLTVDPATAMPPEMRALAGQVTRMMRMEATVTPTEERRRVGRWPARRYQVELTNAMGLAMTMDLWLSEEVELPVERVEMLAVAVAEAQPGGGDWMRQIAALPGFPVLQETRLSVGAEQLVTREELVSIEDRPAPAGAYAPPEGYREEPFSPLPPDPGEPAG